MNNRSQKLASAGPENLNSETKENEGGEPYRNIGRAGSEQSLDAIRVGKTHIDGDCDHHGSEIIASIEFVLETLLPRGSSVDFERHETDAEQAGNAPRKSFKRWRPKVAAE